MGLAAPAGRGRPGRQGLHAGCATSSRRVGWGVRGHVAQWRPQTRGLLGCGGIELRPFPTHTCFRRLVFFRRPASATGAPHPVDLDVVRDELSPAGGDRGRVDAQQGGNAPVAAPPALERLEPGEQTPLPLVEQAGDQHDRSAQLLRHQLGVGQGAYEPGRGPAAGAARAVVAPAAAGRPRNTVCNPAEVDHRIRPKWITESGLKWITESG